MIELTRLNGSPLFVNCDLIKWAEAAPDTMLTLISGEKVVVRESCAEVVERVNAQRVRLLGEVARMTPGAGPLPQVAAAASFHQPWTRNMAAAQDTRMLDSDQEMETS